MPSGTILLQEPITATGARVAVYARITEDEPTASLQEQVCAAQILCHAKGWQVSKIATEIATGSLSDRPALLDLLFTAEADWDILVAAERERLASEGLEFLQGCLAATRKRLVFADSLLADADAIKRMSIETISSEVAQ